MDKEITSEEIGGHDAASCPPISQGKPVIQGDTLEEGKRSQGASMIYEIFSVG
jgi:L-arabinose isomerase